MGAKMPSDLLGILIDGCKKGQKCLNVVCERLLSQNRWVQLHPLTHPNDTPAMIQDIALKFSAFLYHVFELP